jgi:nucleotidyltransferase/DNA polymerase involved in DNA repair
MNASMNDQPNDRMSARTILHVDMDAFFAAVEVRENPRLTGQPVVVGADPRGGRGRGVVAAASYEAREYGIHSAMPIAEAYRRCPHAAYLRPRGSLYTAVSRRIFAMLERYTELVEPLSIDEAFLDVTASEALFGDGAAIARAIKQEVLEQEALTASVGIASSKFIAKLASDLQKPDGLVQVRPGSESRFLAPLEIERLWGAGPKTLAHLHRLGIRTFDDMERLELDELIRAFGKVNGRRFHRLCRGLDDRPVLPDRERKSLGKEITFEADVMDRRVVERTLLRLCEQVAASLRRKDLAGTTVTVKLRWQGFDTVTRQTTLARPVDTFEGIWPVAVRLLRIADRKKRRVRLVGVTLSGLRRAGAGQLSLFEAGEHHDRRVASAIDALRLRFGRHAVTRAALLEEDS